MGIISGLWSSIDISHNSNAVLVATSANTCFPNIQDINALSNFTVNGLLDYISRLGAGNWGLAVAVMMADPETPLTEESQTLVRKALAAKVEGRFDYTLARGRISEEVVQTSTNYCADADAVDYSESDSD